MKNNPLSQLSKYGQSFWFDNIQRAMLNNGELDSMIREDDLRGITSNPTIFEKAITSGSDYDPQILQLLKNRPDADNRSYFFDLAIADIQAAADKLQPVYEQSGCRDGYVSLEVSPDLAHDTQASIDEARDLFMRIQRPNVMIKIPATRAGVPAIEQLIADGINVNATLLFSRQRYEEVARAYLNGLQQRHARGHRVDNVSSVASFFVSRVDSKLDPLLEQQLQNGQPQLQGLRGRLAILNAKQAYLSYQSLMEQPAFKELQAAGAQAQRLLWASTGTKNPDYSDVLYIEELIGPHTVNTVPPATRQAFLAHGRLAETLLQGVQNAAQQFTLLEQAGIDVDKAMEELEEEGVAAFAKSFDNLLEAIGEKRQQLGQASSSSAA